MKDSITYRGRLPRWVVAVAASTLMMVTGPLYGSISFTPLGDLVGGDFYSSANAVSNNGVVVGYSTSGNGNNEAFRWTAADGMHGLGDLPGGRFGSIATGISANGSVVVGRSSTSSGTKSVRWNDADEISTLSGLPWGFYSSDATGVSADGSVIVGQATSSSIQGVYSWTQVGGMEAIGVSGRANDVSADGTVVVGRSGNEAFRWTEAGGMEGLGDLPGGSTYSEATGASGDGSVVVGFGFSTGQEAFRWADGQMEGLGRLPGTSYSSALDVSSYGQLIVGTSGNSAFIWDESNQMRSLQDLIEDALGGLNGWTLNTATGISDNGRYIVGHGTNSDSNTEAWLIDLGTTVVPEPLSVLVWGGLTCFAALVINTRRRV